MLNSLNVRFVFAVPFIASAFFAGTRGQPDAAEIVKCSVRVTESNWAVAPLYSYVSRNANPPQQTAKTYEISMIQGSPYRKLVAEDDKPLTESMRNQEEEKFLREMRKREHESEAERRRRMAKYHEDRERDHIMLTEIANAFDYALIGEEAVQDYTAWVVQGLPKPGYIAQSRDARVMAAMKVKLWIDKASYQWLKVQAEVLKPVSLFGALAKVGPGTRFELEQQPVGSNVWLPKHFTMDVRASALGFLSRQISEDCTYKSYRRLAEPSAALRTAP